MDAEAQQRLSTEDDTDYQPIAGAGGYFKKLAEKYRDKFLKLQTQHIALQEQFKHEKSVTEKITSVRFESVLADKNGLINELVLGKEMLNQRIDELLDQNAYLTRKCDSQQEELKVLHHKYCQCDNEAQEKVLRAQKEASDEKDRVETKKIQQI